MELLDNSTKSVLELFYQISKKTIVILAKKIVIYLIGVL